MEVIRMAERCDVVHEWHESDQPLTACGLEITDLRMACG